MSSYSLTASDRMRQMPKTGDEKMKTLRNPQIKQWYDTRRKINQFRVIVDDRRTSTNMRMVAIFDTEAEAMNYIEVRA